MRRRAGLDALHREARRPWWRAGAGRAAPHQGQERPSPDLTLPSGNGNPAIWQQKLASSAQYMGSPPARSNFALFSPGSSRAQGRSPSTAVNQFRTDRTEPRNVAEQSPSQRSPTAPTPAHPRQKAFLPPFEFCTARTEFESAVNGQPSPRLGGLRPWAAKYCKISQV